jgi:hypothetical protein
MPTCEVRRIPLPRTWVNRGKKKGRGCVLAPALGIPPLERGGWYASLVVVAAPAPPSPAHLHTGGEQIDILSFELLQTQRLILTNLSFLRGDFLLHRFHLPYLEGGTRQPHINTPSTTFVDKGRERLRFSPCSAVGAVPVGPPMYPSRSWPSEHLRSNRWEDAVGLSSCQTSENSSSTTFVDKGKKKGRSRVLRPAFVVVRRNYFSRFTPTLALLLGRPRGSRSPRRPVSRPCGRRAGAH